MMSNRLSIGSGAAEMPTMFNADVSWRYSQSVRYDVPISSIKAVSDSDAEDEDIRLLAERHAGTLKALGE